MKIRSGFVSNSSSSSFIITNKTDEDLDLVHFVKENPELVVDFREVYDWHTEEHYNEEAMLSCAIHRDILLPAKSEDEHIFGDEDGDVLGAVFDYMLREGGESASFKWRFCQYYR